MPRKPTDTAHVNLRIREDLRRKIEREADRHRFSLNNEIRIRLENSFTAADADDLHTLIQDLKIQCARTGASQELVRLGDRMVDAIESGKPIDPTLAPQWRAARRVLDTGGVI